jgi:hypothetical protein
MTIAGRNVPIAVFQWLGVLAAPTAWAALHIFGVLLALAECAPAGRVWNLPLHGLTIAATAVAAVTAVIGLLAAIATVRLTGPQDDPAPPPPGRIHFLGVVGIAISPLFLAIILMAGVGVSVQEVCRQS